MTPDDQPVISQDAITERPRMRRRLTTARLRPILVRRDPAAELCDVSPETWDRWSAAGFNPEPVKRGAVLLWCLAELRCWADHGCPPRAEWKPIWSAVVRGRRIGRGR